MAPWTRDYDRFMNSKQEKMGGVTGQRNRDSEREGMTTNGPVSWFLNLVGDVEVPTLVVTKTTDEMYLPTQPGVWEQRHEHCTGVFHDTRAP